MILQSEGFNIIHFGETSFNQTFPFAAFLVHFTPTEQVCVWGMFPCMQNPNVKMKTFKIIHIICVHNLNVIESP